MQEIWHTTASSGRVKQSLQNSILRYINALFSDSNELSSDLWYNVKRLGFGKKTSWVPV